MQSATQPDASGTLLWEWRLQALVVVCNVVPALLIAGVVAVVFFFLVAVIGLGSWIVGGAIVAILLGYAGLCLITAGALRRRRGWSRFPALGISLLYLPFWLVWVSPAKPREPAPAPAYLQDQQPVQQSAAEVASAKARARETLTAWIPRPIAAGLRLLPFMNLVALAHLVLRWRQFSQSAAPAQVPKDL